MTHLHNITRWWTRLDQVFISKDLLDAMITCNALPDRPGINTDHLLILTTLDFALARAPKGFPKNFHDLDWEEFIKKLETKLNLLDPPTHIHMQEELDKACRELTVAIQDMLRSDFIFTTQTRWTASFPISLFPTPKPMYDTIWRLVLVRYDLADSPVYDIYLRATHTTILSTRGVQIPICLVSSTTDSF